MPIINNPLLIDSNCIFFKNHSYTCKTNCDSQSFDPIEYPVQGTPKLYYYLYNCSDDLNTKRGSWNTNDGMFSSRSDSIFAETCQKSQLVFFPVIFQVWLGKMCCNAQRVRWWRPAPSTAAAVMSALTWRTAVLLAVEEESRGEASTRALMIQVKYEGDPVPENKRQIAHWKYTYGISQDNDPLK